MAHMCVHAWWMVGFRFWLCPSPDARNAALHLDYAYAKHVLDGFGHGITGCCSTDLICGAMLGARLF